MRIRARWVFCMLPLLLCGCAAATVRAKVEDFQEVRVNPPKFAGQRIVVSGFLQEDALGNVLLYMSKSDAVNKNYANEIDIVSKKKMDLTKRASGGQCASVLGKFVPFDSQTVGTGYLRSHIGLIEAERITRYACTQQNDPP